MRGNNQENDMNTTMQKTKAFRPPRSHCREHAGPCTCRWPPGLRAPRLRRAHLDPMPMPSSVHWLPTAGRCQRRCREAEQPTTCREIPCIPACDDNIKGDGEERTIKGDGGERTLRGLGQTSRVGVSTARFSGRARTHTHTPTHAQRACFTTMQLDIVPRLDHTHAHACWSPCLAHI